MFCAKEVDEKLGVFYGTFCFGISARWWKDEHVIHHALTNTVDHDSNFVDPQAHEEAWIQNEKLFTLPTTSVKEFCVSVSSLHLLQINSVENRATFIALDNIYIYCSRPLFTRSLRP